MPWKPGRVTAGRGQRGARAHRGSGVITRHRNSGKQAAHSGPRASCAPSGWAEGPLPWPCLLRQGARQVSAVTQKPWLVRCSRPPFLNSGSFFNKGPRIPLCTSQGWNSDPGRAHMHLGTRTQPRLAAPQGDFHHCPLQNSPDVSTDVPIRRRGPMPIGGGSTVSGALWCVWGEPSAWVPHALPYGACSLLPELRQEGLTWERADSEERMCPAPGLEAMAKAFPVHRPCPPHGTIAGRTHSRSLRAGQDEEEGWRREGRGAMGTLWCGRWPVGRGPQAPALPCRPSPQGSVHTGPPRAELALVGMGTGCSGRTPGTGVPGRPCPAHTAALPGLCALRGFPGLPGLQRGNSDCTGGRSGEASTTAPHPRPCRPRPEFCPGYKWHPVTPRPVTPNGLWPPWPSSARPMHPSQGTPRVMAAPAHSRV